MVEVKTFQRPFGATSPAHPRKIEFVAELDSRKVSILKAVIVEYVQSAEPIGSEALSQRYELGVKSATIRNEMAELADLGYLDQPHTSAGRIPSDLGYRYYVDHLPISSPDEQARKRLTQVASDGDALTEMLRDTVRALSRTTQLLGAATTVRSANITVKTAVVSVMGPTQALFVLVMSNGHVANRMIEIPAGLTLEELGKVNELLRSATSEQPLRVLVKLKHTATGNPREDKLLSSLFSNTRQASSSHMRGALITEGEEFIYAQPEFRRDAGYVHQLLNEIIESDVLYETMYQDVGSEVVLIGRENKHEQMQQLSVVRQSFFIGTQEAGTIALVGPTRMAYDTSIPLVHFTARALTTSLTKFFG